MFEIEVTNNRASTKRGELLTKGQVGAQVQFTFNDHWTGMKKTAVFKRCGKTIVVMDSEWNGDIITVPPEMTEEAGLLVHVGVYGVSEDGERITPTLYAPLGAVALGAEPKGDPSTNPTLPVWAQIQAQINTLAVDDAIALRMVAYYPEWTAGTAYAAGDRLVYNGDLYKVLKAHTAQETWLPGTGTESLYVRIDEQHDGTKYDPIPYNGNMALEAGKYYSQSGVTYLCTRDTGIAVYQPLADLVGVYVEEVTA